MTYISLLGWLSVTDWMSPIGWAILASVSIADKEKDKLSISCYKRSLNICLLFLAWLSGTGTIAYFSSVYEFKYCTIQAGHKDIAGMKSWRIRYLTENKHVCMLRLNNHIRAIGKKNFRCSRLVTLLQLQEPWVMFAFRWLHFNRSWKGWRIIMWQPIYHTSSSPSALLCSLTTY